MKSCSEIREELAAAEAARAEAIREFIAAYWIPAIPAGTPDRRRLHREVNERNQAAFLAFGADYETKCAKLREELRRAESAEARRAAANTPAAIERRRIFAALRKLGFERESVSGRSAYYSRGCFAVRVSDHEVPMTESRRHALDNGGRSWANSRWSFVVGDEDADEWLAEISEHVAPQRGDQ